MPAFEPEAVALLLPVAPAVEELLPVAPAGEELLPAAPAGEVLLAPETPAELGEAAAEVRGVDVVEAAPPVPKLTEPTASWTLSGGAGITPLRTWLARPEELLVEVLAPAAAEGAALLPAPAAPLAAGRALLVLEVDVLLLPVALVPPLELLPLVLPLAMQAGLAAEVAPPVAPAALDGRDDGLVAGRALAAVDAAGLVLAAPLAAVLGAVIGPVLVLGAALPPPPPQAASTSDAAASVGRSGRIVMDGFLRVDLATTPGEMLVPDKLRAAASSTHNTGHLRLRYSSAQCRKAIGGPMSSCSSPVAAPWCWSW